MILKKILLFPIFKIVSDTKTGLDTLVSNRGTSRDHVVLCENRFRGRGSIAVRRVGTVDYHKNKNISFQAYFFDTFTKHRKCPLILYYITVSKSMHKLLTFDFFQKKDAFSEKV